MGENFSRWLVMWRGPPPRLRLARESRRVFRRRRRRTIPPESDRGDEREEKNEEGGEEESKVVGPSPLLSSARWERKPEVGELLWRASAVGEEEEAGAAVPEEEDLSSWAPEELCSVRSEEPAEGKHWARKQASELGTRDWRWRLRRELGAEP